MRFVRVRFGVSVNGYHSGELYDLEEVEAMGYVDAKYADIVPYPSRDTVTP